MLLSVGERLAHVNVGMLDELPADNSDVDDGSYIDDICGYHERK